MGGDCCVGADILIRPQSMLLGKIFILCPAGWIIVNILPDTEIIVIIPDDVVVISGLPKILTRIFVRKPLES